MLIIETKRHHWRRSLEGSRVKKPTPTPLDLVKKSYISTPKYQSVIMKNINFFSRQKIK